MFGSYEFGVSLDIGDTKIETYEDSRLYVYHRKPGDIEKVLSSPCSLVVNPIEPVTQPKKVTQYLLIELKTPVVLIPDDDLEFFATFPVEIGVFAETEKSISLGFFGDAKGSIEVIDTFTLTNPKYTLYGTPDKGVVCKWWGSGVFKEVPEVNPLIEGVLKVTIQNRSKEWVELKKLVFDAYSMEIYYRDIAYADAVVNIMSNRMAETSFEKKPLTEGMSKAVDVFDLSKLPLVEKESFVMGWGL